MISQSATSMALTAAFHTPGSARGLKRQRISCMRRSFSRGSRPSRKGVRSDSMNRRMADPGPCPSSAVPVRPWSVSTHKRSTEAVRRSWNGRSRGMFESRRVLMALIFMVSSLRSCHRNVLRLRYATPVLSSSKGSGRTVWTNIPVRPEPFDKLRTGVVERQRNEVEGRGSVDHVFSVSNAWWRRNTCASPGRKNTSRTSRIEGLARSDSSMARDDTAAASSIG